MLAWQYAGDPGKRAVSAGLRAGVARQKAWGARGILCAALVAGIY